MDISEVIVKMVGISAGNLHDIDHFLKVYAYARTIAEREGLSAEERRRAEIAAVIHDIACPLCREKYGNTEGKRQETEGAVLARDFLKDTDLPAETVERVVFLVGHHHTPQEVDGMDYQVLLEADFLVNAGESGYSKASIRHALERIFRTETGKKLLQEIYLAP